jgi:SAM-dependent methyltransferase
MKNQLAGALAQDYAAKGADYYKHPRPEMVPFIPQSCRRILDVGCGNGEFAAYVKSKLSCEAWGVEPNRESALLATKRLDRVVEGCFSSELELPLNYFDCIVFNDVLEHMLDPAAALSHARTCLTRDGVVVVSIPNVGHFPNVWQLVMKGQWEYKERGILDRTHLRFFTRKSIVKLFEGERYQVQRITGINEFGGMEGDGRLWLLYRVIALLPVSSIRDMRYVQFAAVARPLAQETRMAGKAD